MSYKHIRYRRRGIHRLWDQICSVWENIIDAWGNISERCKAGFSANKAHQQFLEPGTENAEVSIQTYRPRKARSEDSFFGAGETMLFDDCAAEPESTGERVRNRFWINYQPGTLIRYDIRIEGAIVVPSRRSSFESKTDGNNPFFEALISSEKVTGFFQNDISIPSWP